MGGNRPKVQKVLETSINRGYCRLCLVVTTTCAKWREIESHSLRPPNGLRSFCYCIFRSLREALFGCSHHIDDFPPVVYSWKQREGSALMPETVQVGTILMKEWPGMPLLRHFRRRSNQYRQT